ncbi:MAG TPA: response regulator transcription factor [Bryobacteraceae bacterium]|nr:response regulator transcription factor [Bryobacteraceae bacterium]
MWIETASAVTRAGLESLLAPSLDERGGIELVDSPAHADVILRDEIPDGHEGSDAIPSVVLSEDRFTSRLTGWGVHAVLPREAAAEQIVAALYAVAAGLIAIPVEASAAVIPVAPEASVENLTPREMEALEMLAEGLSNKQIAARLNISEHTAKFHVNSILNKLGAGTRTEAVMRGLRRGLLKM